MKLSEFNRKLKNEYKNTFKDNKPKRVWNFNFRLRYAFLGIFVLVFIGLFIDHIAVQVFNHNLDDRREELVNSTEYSSINDKNDYKMAIKNYSYKEKSSILSNLLSIRMGCGAKGTGGNMMPPTAPDSSGNNSFDTNVQVDGIDEADVSKCDGNYVYSLARGSLIIYSLSGSVVTSIVDNGNELYVKDNYIVSIGDCESSIYEFNNNSLIERYNVSYDSYIDSRLKGNHIYFVSRNKINEENVDYGNCYYDGMCYPNFGYSITDYNLENNEIKTVQALSGYDVNIYMSNDNFYVASLSNITKVMTSIMMFDHNLNPIGVMKIEGSINNQFSMDEYNGYFRVVSTDNTKNAERINAISIFDLYDLSLVGYLDEGIGIGRQTIRSVRFDKNTCYAVTYENSDPLYEINLDDPTKPVIVSKYEAPGYSNYLHNFIINGQEYVLGLGFTDSMSNTKISVYINTDNTVQIGEDYILGFDYYYDNCDYVNRQLNISMFSNHKSLFIYNDGTYLYLGANVAADEYVIFKIDVTNERYPTSIYKTITLDDRYDVRSFLVEGKLLVTTYDKLLVLDWNNKE